MSYAAFTIDKQTRESLLAMFPPKYSNVSLDHITIQYPCDDEGALFEPESVAIEGYVDDGKGIEALLVRLNGDIFKSNGLPWHITLSLDKDKQAPNHLIDTALSDKTNYAPVMSNTLIKLALNKSRDNYAIEYLNEPVTINVSSAILGKPETHSQEPHSDAAPAPHAN